MTNTLLYVTTSSRLVTGCQDGPGWPFNLPKLIGNFISQWAWLCHISWQGNVSTQKSPTWSWQVSSLRVIPWFYPTHSRSSTGSYMAFLLIVFWDIILNPAETLHKNRRLGHFSTCQYSNLLLPLTLPLRLAYILRMSIWSIAHTNQCKKGLSLSQGILLTFTLAAELVCFELWFNPASTHSRAVVCFCRTGMHAALLSTQGLHQPVAAYRILISRGEQTWLQNPSRRRAP